MGWGANIYKINYVCGICTFIRLRKTTQHGVVLFCFLVKLGLKTYISNAVSQLHVNNSNITKCLSWAVGSIFNFLLNTFLNIATYEWEVSSHTSLHMKATSVAFC